MGRDRREPTRTVTRAECEQHLRKAKQYLAGARTACEEGAADAGAIDASLTDWCNRVAGLTGNAVAEIVLRSSEVASLDPRLRSEMRRDGIPLIP